MPRSLAPSHFTISRLQSQTPAVPRRLRLWRKNSVPPSFPNPFKRLALDEAVRLISANVTAIQADASKLEDLDRVVYGGVSNV